MTETTPTQTTPTQTPLTIEEFAQRVLAYARTMEGPGINRAGNCQYSANPRTGRPACLIGQFMDEATARRADRQINGSASAKDLRRLNLLPPVLSAIPDLLLMDVQDTHDRQPRRGYSTDYPFSRVLTEALERGALRKYLPKPPTN